MSVLLNRNLFRKCATKKEGFQWVQNSCYLDSVLWVLFSSPTPFVDKKMLFSTIPPDQLHKIAPCGKNQNDLNEKMFIEFQMKFRQIAYYFRCGVGEEKTCSGFRNLFKTWFQNPRCTCINKNIRFHSSEQHEAQEFLQFIFSIYGMNGQEQYKAVSKRDVYYGVSQVPRSDTVFQFIEERKDKKPSFIWNVSYQTLKNTKYPQRTMENFLVRQEENWNVPNITHKKCRFNVVRTIQSFLKLDDLFVFSLERTHPIQQTVSHFRVQISETITDSKGKQLSLFGIICHEGETTNRGHYTAFSLSTTDHQWYYYDDINLPIKKVGSWKDMSSMKQVFTHCVLLFYTKL